MTLLDAPQPEAPARRPLRLRLPSSALDPVLVGLVALTVFTLHGFTGPLNRDLGVFVYGGEQVARGVPPYVGIFNTVGPLADAVPGLGIWLGHLAGLDPVLSARLLFLVLSALCLALVSVLARDTFGSRAAGFLAPSVFLTFECFVELASGGPREKTTMLVFLVASLILVGRRRWLAAGVCAALATLTWQPALFVAVTAVVVAALTAGPQGRARALLRFVAGGAIPLAVTVVYFARVGAARQAFDGFFLVNSRYTSQPSIFDPTTLGQLWLDYHVSLVAVALGLVALLVLAGRAAPYAMLADGVPTVAWRLTTVGAAGLTATVWTICVVNGGPDLFVVLPAAALGAAGALVLLAARLPHVAAVPAVAVLAAVCVVVGGTEAVATRKDTLVQERADVRAVLATQPADATLVSIDAPQALAVVGRTSSWPFQLFDERMDDYLDATQPDGMVGLGHRLAREDPTFVVVGGIGALETWPLTTLADQYHRVGRGPGWTWYLSDAAGPEALAAARAANLAAMGR